jgi:hypothetical protein
MTLAGQMAARMYTGLRNDIRESTLRNSPVQTWWAWRCPSRESRQAFFEAWTAALQGAFDVAPAITRGDCASAMERVAFNWSQLAEQSLHTRWYGRIFNQEHMAEIYDFYYEEMAHFVVPAE